MLRVFFSLFFVVGLVLTSSSQLVNDQLLDEALLRIGNGSSTDDQKIVVVSRDVLFSPILRWFVANPLRLGGAAFSNNGRNPVDQGTSRWPRLLIAIVSCILPLSDRIDANQQVRSSSANLFRN